MDLPGIERGRVAQINAAGDVLVTLDRFHRSRPAVAVPIAAPLTDNGNALDPDTGAAVPHTHHALLAAVAVGDHVLVACVGGSLDDLVLLARLA